MAAARSRNRGAGPSSDGASRRSSARRSAQPRRRPPARPRPRPRRRQLDPDQVRERRIARAPAAARARRRGSRPRRGRPRADRGRVGRQRLHQHAPAALAAPAAAGELGDQREGPLLGAEVGEPEGRVGVDDDAEDDVGEVVALGDHLGADEDPGVRLVEAAEDLRMAARGRRRCRSRGGTPGTGATSSASSASIRSVPAPARARLTEPQSRAGLRDRLRVPAVVAAERLLGAVDDERDVAVGALPGMPAGAAGQVRRPAAPVDHHDRLAAARRRAGRARARVVGCSGPGLRGAAAHVEHLDRRQRAAVDALGSSRRSSASQLSGRGVAVPATRVAPASAARRRATSRAS